MNFQVGLFNSSIIKDIKENNIIYLWINSLISYDENNIIYL